MGRKLISGKYFKKCLSNLKLTTKLTQKKKNDFSGIKGQITETTQNYTGSH